MESKVPLSYRTTKLTLGTFLRIMFRPRYLDRSKIPVDGACIDACPVEVFEWIDTPNSTASDKKAIMIREDECIICRACESVCPVEAVLITED